jgi:hypothetical protein
MAAWTHDGDQTIWIAPRDTSFECVCDECRRLGYTTFLHGTIARGVEHAIVRCRLDHHVRVVRAAPLPALSLVARPS